MDRSRHASATLRAPSPFTRRALFLVGLRAVHVREGRSVEDDVGGVGVQEALEGRPVGDVHLGQVGGFNLETRRLEDRQRVPAEHPVGA